MRMRDPRHRIPELLGWLRYQLDRGPMTAEQIERHQRRRSRPLPDDVVRRVLADEVAEGRVAKTSHKPAQFVNTVKLPPPRTTTVGAMLSPAERFAVNKACEELGVSLSAFLRAAIQRQLNDLSKLR